MVDPFALNLRHLRALSAIVAEGTVSGAATRVGLSQPALTQGVAKLERQLDVALFDRHSGGLVATAAGAAMAARVAAAFARLAEGTRGTRRGRGFARPEHLMTATQLDALLRVADAGGFSDAARAPVKPGGGAGGGIGGGIGGGTGAKTAGETASPSQPALHRAVRELEQLMGIVLVERRGRGSMLTAAGRRLVRGTRLAAGELTAGIAEAGPDRSRTGRIAIGAMPLSRALVLPRALAAFTRAWPGIRIEVVEGAWRELAEPLRDGVLDLTVGALRDATPPDLTQRPLMTDRLAIVARADHPLTTEGEPSLARLADFPWIVGSAGTPLADQWVRLFDGRALPRAPVASGSVMVIRGMLVESDLLTLLSPDQVALEIRTGVLATIGAPLAGSLRTIGITTRADWRPTDAQRALLGFVATAARESRHPKNE